MDYNPKTNKQKAKPDKISAFVLAGLFVSDCGKRAKSNV